MSYLPIQEGEMNANDAVKFFDNICDEDGSHLVKSAKRSRLKELMSKLFYLHPEKNVCHLSDGQDVPIIVCRQNPGRAAFCYFNNIDAPQDEIFQAFAQIYNMTYLDEKLPQKHPNELIATDAKQYLDNIYENDKKLAGAEKLKRLHHLFYDLYCLKEQNTCHTPDGDISIIVKRKGENNRPTYCLNTKVHRSVVFRAFADWAKCSYLEEKEYISEPPMKQSGELTARECARIFHDVPNQDGSYVKRDASPKLVEWFSHIAQSPSLNQVSLPDGNIVPLIVKRKSHSQTCFCLNTGDENIKPFVIFRTADVIKAQICFDNIPITSHKCSFKTFKNVINKANNSSGAEHRFYRVYAETLYSKLNFGKNITLDSWLKNAVHER